MKSFIFVDFIKTITLCLVVGLTAACHYLPLEYTPPPLTMVPLQSGGELTAKWIGTMTDRGLRLTVDAIFFEVDKANLRAEGVRKIGEFVELIQQNSSRLVYIEGHTDSTGEVAYNQQLSEQRAHTVRSALLAKGVTPARLVAKGYGETQPIASNATKEGRQQNRRVEVLISNDLVDREITPILPFIPANFCSQHPKLSWRKCQFPLVEEKL